MSFCSSLINYLKSNLLDKLSCTSSNRLCSPVCNSSCCSLYNQLCYSSYNPTFINNNYLSKIQYSNIGFNYIIATICLPFTLCGNQANIYYIPISTVNSTAKGTNLQVVALCHGTGISVDKYTYLIESLLNQTQANGNPKYIVVANTFQYGGLANMGIFGRNTITYIKICQGNGYLQPSFLNGKVNSNVWYGVGHSLGGGALAYTEAEYPTGCQGVLMLSPASDLSGSKDKFKNCIKPTFVLTGTKDCVVTDAYQDYQNIPTTNTQRYFSNMEGASHCQWAPGSIVCTLVEFCSAGISTEQQDSATIQLMLFFF